MPEVLEQAAAKLGIAADALIENAVREQAQQQAMAEPLPGAMRDAVLQRVPVKAGAYYVRACCDGDIEYLSALQYPDPNNEKSKISHPLNELRLEVASIGATEPDERKKAFDAIWEKFIEKHNYRGRMAWDICWLFTRSLDEVDEVFERGGLDAIQKSARKEFSRLPPRAVMEITPICITQYLRSWNPMLSYEAAASESDEGEVVVKKN